MSDVHRCPMGCGNGRFAAGSASLVCLSGRVALCNAACVIITSQRCFVSTYPTHGKRLVACMVVSGGTDRHPKGQARCGRCSTSVLDGLARGLIRPQPATAGRPKAVTRLFPATLLYKCSPSIAADLASRQSNTWTRQMSAVSSKFCTRDWVRVRTRQEAST
jgi:hypothetical protein